MSDRFDLDLLRLVSLVAEAGNFSRAAQVLGRTQSAVSMQAKRCETIAGVPLFVRGARKVRLTPAGERLAAHARRILAVEAQARAELAGREPETLRLGVPDDYAHLLPVILPEFAAERPGATVRIFCEPSAKLFGLIEAGDLDLALVTRGRSHRAEVLRLEPSVWVAARSVGAEHLDPLPLALYQPGCIGRDHALQALSASGRSVRIAYESPSMVGLAAVVRAGLAVAALARLSVPPDLRVVEAEAGLPSLPALEIGLAQPERGRSAAADGLAEAIRRAVSSHADASSATAPS